MTDTKQISYVTFTQLVVAIALCCFALFPVFAEAAQPDVTGQDRAASVGKKSQDSNATTVDEESETDEDEDEDEEDGVGNGKAKKNTNGPVGLIRAADVGNKPEAIRNQLRMILTLILEMKLNGGGGIGSALSEFIAGGRVMPDGDGDGPTTDLFAAVLTSSSDTVLENSTTTASDDSIEYELVVEVTATGTDLVIPDEISMEATSSVGIVFGIQNASSTAVTDGDVLSATLTSSAAASSSEYTILDGETETFTITVEFDPAESGMYRLQLEEMQVNGTFYQFTPASDFRSDYVSI